MKTKYVSLLAAVVATSLGANSAHAIQKHDPIFQTPLPINSQANDPDMVRQVCNQSGSPRRKPDLYGAHPIPGIVDRDSVREVRFLNGRPKSKMDH
jgi:hypothetical protein